MARTPTPSVLVVAYDWMTLSMLSILLTDSGYTVKTVRDPASAVKAIERSKPDLVLVDLDTVGEDDYMFLDALRYRWGRSPKVMALTSEQGHDSAVLREAKFDSWIEKPFDVDHLLAQIDRHVQRKYVA